MRPVCSLINKSGNFHEKYCAQVEQVICLNMYAGIHPHEEASVIFFFYVIVSVLLNNVVCSPCFWQVCSDINKPNGQFILPNERIAVMTFISSLPIRKVCRGTGYFAYSNKKLPILIKKYRLKILLLFF